MKKTLVFCELKWKMKSCLVSEASFSFGYKNLIVNTSSWNVFTWTTLVHIVLKISQQKQKSYLSKFGWQEFKMIQTVHTFETAGLFGESLIFLTNVTSKFFWHLQLQILFFDCEDTDPKNRFIVVSSLIRLICTWYGRCQAEWNAIGMSLKEDCTEVPRPTLSLCSSNR